MKQSREVENKEQTDRKRKLNTRSKETTKIRYRVESFKTRSKPFQRNYREFQRKEQPARKGLANFEWRLENLKQSAKRWKGTREFQKKERTARKRLEKFGKRLEQWKTCGKPLEEN